ncbi:MAG: hypothetical protein K0R47_4874 [Brevibacillus sp.]|nr:hypothetical protein [Brevibacillus sp.]
MGRKRWSVYELQVCAVALTFFVGGCVPSAHLAEAGEAPILADIGATRQHLLITNNNTFVWRQVTFIVNGTYRYQMENVPRGSTSITLSSFVDDFGQAFTSTAAGLRHVDIDIVDTSSGKRGSFDW